MKRLVQFFIGILGLCLVTAEEFDAEQYALRYWKRWKGITPDIAYPATPPKEDEVNKLDFFRGCVEKYAPHWLDEYRAFDKAFGWKDGTYMALCVYGIRKKKAPQGPHECTSWIVRPELTGGKTMYLHKNRDSGSKKLALLRVAVKGKHAWVGIGTPGFLHANSGINDAGLAIAMNSGCVNADVKYHGLYTSYMCRILLEECSCVADAVKLLERMVTEGAYNHGKSGSIWLLADSKEAVIVENSSKYFKAAPIRSGFDVRANAWRYPEMVRHATSSVDDMLGNYIRENMVFKLMVEQCYLSKYRVDVEDIWNASRNRESVGDAIYPICGKWTNSAATFSIDLEFPSELSTAWIACGPPRNTVYIPVPRTISSLPDSVLNGDFGDAAIARFEGKGMDASVRDYVLLEQKMVSVHNEALEKARALLKNGGQKQDAAKILEDAFQKNWKMLEESKALK